MALIPLSEYQKKLAAVKPPSTQVVQQQAQSAVAATQKQATAMATSAQTKAAIEAIKPYLPWAIVGGIAIAGIAILPELIGGSITRKVAKEGAKMAADKVADKVKEPEADLKGDKKATKKEKPESDEEETPQAAVITEGAETGELEQVEVPAEILPPETPNEPVMKELETESPQEDVSIPVEQLVNPAPEPVVEEAPLQQDKAILNENAPVETNEGEASSSEPIVAEEITPEPEITEVVPEPQNQPHDTTIAPPAPVEEPVPEEELGPEIPMLRLTGQRQLHDPETCTPIEAVKAEEPTIVVEKPVESLEPTPEPAKKDKWLRVRIDDPELFDDDTFVTKEVSKNTRLILAKKWGEDKLEVQSLRFRNKESFNEAKKDIEKKYKAKLVEKGDGDYGLDNIKAEEPITKTLTLPPRKQDEIKEIKRKVSRQIGLKKINLDVEPGDEIISKASFFKGPAIVHKAEEYTFTVQDKESGRMYRVLRNMIRRKDDEN